jgi:hypothetical protein
VTASQSSPAQARGRSPRPVWRCRTPPRTSDNHTFDSADRITDPGYVYDAFGRTTTLPSGLNNTYYANELIQRQEQGDSRQIWTLDPAHRFRGFTTDTKVDDTRTNVSSKLIHYGHDSDEPRWIIEDTTLGTITRNVTGPDGDLTATTSTTGEFVPWMNLNPSTASTS